MNFKHMPELELVVGYPFALLLMVVSAIAAVFLLQMEEVAVSKDPRCSGA